MRIAFVRSLLAVALFALLPSAAHAAWPHDPFAGGVRLCGAAGYQDDVRAVSDGLGGIIVVWADARGGDYNIYARRVNAAGQPQWTADGVLVCGAVGSQRGLSVTSDGAGGVIVAWTDFRGGAADVYAQRVALNGVPQWTANGVAVCTATNDQHDPSIVSDGSGGAIVGWADYRAGGNHIYVQRLNNIGVALWVPNGTAMCTASGEQIEPRLVSDGAGGAIAAWSDFRNDVLQSDLYAQRVTSIGAMAWTANGIPLCTAAGSQTELAIARDGSGGAILAWHDSRTQSHDVYAQRVSIAGQLLWSSLGEPICTAPGSKLRTRIVEDGLGGAFLFWADSRSGTWDLYGQHIGANRAPLWGANGLAISTAAGTQAPDVVIGDDAGGAMVIWLDTRHGDDDLYGQRLSSTGSIAWASGGLAISQAAGDQSPSDAVGDGRGGALVAWSDGRNAANGPDVYAQRVERMGVLGDPEPTIAYVRDVPNDEGGRVKVAWNASWLDADPLYGIAEYRVWRSVPPSRLLARDALARRVTHDPDAAARSGGFWADPLAAQDYAWEYVGTTPAAISTTYSMVASTEGDSVAASNPRTAFRIEARAGTFLSSDRWFSPPDSGYSVDNLAPSAPLVISATYAGGAATLSWRANDEADLAAYRVYRGTDVNFVPGPGNLVSSQTSVDFQDAGVAPHIYKLTAVDAHGNESLVVTVLPSGTLDAPGATRALALAVPSPNPARGAALLRWTLSRPGPVRLAVFDATGRRVRGWTAPSAGPGEHAETFDLCDDEGGRLPAGLYLVRLEAEGRVLSRRLAVVR